MPSIVTDPGQVVYDFPFATVESKTSLDGEWAAHAHLFVDKLTLAVNAYDEAELAWEFGSVFHPTEGTFVVYEPLEMLGEYVRITIPQEAPLLDVIWVGVVVSSAVQRSAVKTDPAPNKLTGVTQILRAVGLEYFLDRNQIDSSMVYKSPDPLRIYRPMPFNGGKGVTLDFDTTQRGNRDPTAIGDAYAFVGTGNTAEDWTMAQVLTYLLTFYGPVDSVGDPLPTRYVFDPGDELAGVLDAVCPTLQVEGLTVFEVLNRLLAPQRGFVWWAEFDEAFLDPHQVRIRVETITGTLITLPTLGTIPANRDQQSLDFDEETDVEDVILSEMGSRVYHQIIARGARMTCTCTLAFGDDTLEEDWSLDIETEYRDAAVDLPDAPTYAAYGTEDKEKKNDAFRRAEKFYRVYCAYRIPADWDGKTGDGDASTRNWTIPELSPTGSVLGGTSFSIEGLRLLNTTRLKRGWDYEVASAPVETTPTGTAAEYMPPFAILQVSESPAKYQYADKMSDPDFVEGTEVSAEIQTSYHLHMQQNVPGVILRPTNGVNHALALTGWAETEPSANEAEVDYGTVRATVTMEADLYAEARYPEDASLPADVPLQKLVLYTGDEYRVDFLAANTVVHLHDGEPITTDGAVLRDDRKSLQDIARVTYEWYRIEHFPMTVRFLQLGNHFRLGMLITVIGTGTTQQIINTVVSAITYDTKAGILTVKTNDQGLDLEQLA